MNLEARIERPEAALDGLQAGEGPEPLTRAERLQALAELFDRARRRMESDGCEGLAVKAQRTSDVLRGLAIRYERGELSEDELRGHLKPMTEVLLTLRTRDRDGAIRETPGGD
jgi:hypothetical protein